MADISIQFHAIAEEIRDFVMHSVSDFDLHVIAIRYPPYEAVELSPSQVEEAFADSPAQYDELAFTLHQPKLPADGNLELVDKNPDVLRLLLGKASGQGLKQSWLSACAQDSAAIRIWKKIAKRLREMTEKGARAMNTETGEKGPVLGFRYTAGAKSLEASGLPMLDIGGRVVLVLEPTGDADSAND